MMMQPYIVFLNTKMPEKLLLIKEGFNWLAFIMPPIWAAYNKLWNETCIFILGLLSLGWFLISMGFDLDGLAVVYLSASTIFGSIANDLKTRRIIKIGYAPNSILYGESGDHIVAQFYRNNEKFKQYFVET
jgi:hypothetical protein